ncbi:MAG: hypothetical protein ACK58X_12375 [Planctomycetota bacterium]
MLPARCALTLARRLAAVAALVLALGLPRFFVLCAEDGGPRHIEFVHLPGECCELPSVVGEHPARTHAPATAPTGGVCDHVELAIELAPSPRSDDVAAAVTPACTAVQPIAVVAIAAARACLRSGVCATGPPPWRSRLQQQATVRLQV